MENLLYLLIIIKNIYLHNIKKINNINDLYKY